MFDIAFSLVLPKFLHHLFHHFQNQCTLFRMNSLKLKSVSTEFAGSYRYDGIHFGQWCIKMQSIQLFLPFCFCQSDRFIQLICSITIHIFFLCFEFGCCHSQELCIRCNYYSNKNDLVMFIL